VSRAATATDLRGEGVLGAELRRLDLELVARGLARSRAQAQEMISGGGVRVDGVVARRAATRVDATSVLLEASADHYVSRAAHKLAGALDDLGLAVPSRALDAGASTGGFTQVLLERGCRQVIAVDVGTDQLAERLRTDPRIRSWPQTNLRDLTLAHVEGVPVDLVVADVSFISLTLLVAPLLSVTAADGELLLLVKPQFEVGRERLASGGVVHDDGLRRQAVDGVVASAEVHGWAAAAVVPSRIRGAAGNIELFVLLRGQER
jgi:23S rRNA (cytidine1920-2'-O)/16S rRNA (cytidine1409-2'-O)-methyltransferase